ncbi:nucleotidyl transferase AbiEii/AbiGii toxin family protein [Candidatus Falkowbacteria bacterium]|nr:nucleotidyl transferase AbiEii/AbiGii toxin family protein [Candidatus Falkowbacteria bacterium]
MVPVDQVKQGFDTLFFDALPKAVVLALKKCSEMDFFSQGNWYLAGGTALALQSGHRRSYDLDFFTKNKIFDEKKVEKILNDGGEWITNAISKGTVYGIFSETKMSFISYPYFKPAEKMRNFGTVSLLTPPDIAVMKIIAISQRGKKRDFFDLYWICRNVESLRNSILKVDKQYSVRQNLIHILKSLVYFKDAESDPEPEIYFDANWKKVKSFFTKEIPIIAEKIIK